VFLRAGLAQLFDLEAGLLLRADGRVDLPNARR